MSIVANVVCKYASWVVSDGRGRNSTTHEIISETIKKAIMINKNVCVAYTGTLEVANGVLKILRSVPIESEPSDRIFEMITQILENSTIDMQSATSFLVTGVNGNGDIASYTIGTNLAKQSLIPKDEQQFSFAVLSSGNFDLSLSKYVLDEIESSKSVSNTGITNAIKRFCNDVADLDDSVNKNLSVVEIRK